MVQHFCTCDKNSPCLVMPRHERVFSPVQTFAHFFMMRYLNASLRAMSREHGMSWEVVTGFLGNELLSSYQKLGCNTSMKIHFLSSHLYSFQRTVVLWVMSRVNISTRTLQQWRADTKGNAAHQYVLIIAGPWCVILQIRRSIGRQRRPYCTRAIRNLRLITQYRLRDDSSKM